MPQASTADGANLINYSCHTGNNQKWTFPAMNVVSAATEMCLDLPGGDTTKGIQLWSCVAPVQGVKWGHENQLWAYDPVDDTIRIRGKCLEVPNDNINNGTQLRVNTCGGYARQKWYPYNGGFRSGLGSTPYKCIDVRGGVAANGTAIQIWDCDSGHPNQKFALRGPVKNLHSGKCMDLEGGSTANYTPIQQWACTVGHPNQVWTLWMP